MVGIKPFWQNKKMEKFTNDEWEQICCRCGLCCLLKIQDEETGDIFYTRVICHLFDREKYLCRMYENRCSLVPECLKVTPENVGKLPWMPRKCAYRILYETGDLPEWHPLKGGVGVPRLPENLERDNLVDEQMLEDYIIEDEEF